jgi:hypothetical protein
VLFLELLSADTLVAEEGRHGLLGGVLVLLYALLGSGLVLDRLGLSLLRSGSYR